MLFAAKNKHVQIIIMLLLLSMCGRHLSNGIRLPCSFSCSQIDSHHVKIFEDVLFEYYNDSEAVEKTMLMISLIGVSISNIILMKASLYCL